MSSPTSGFALKFISGKYQGGEFPLLDDRTIIVGRSSELDMVLVEDMVSRKHAKITVAGGKITIEDLGSTNGTFVNGEKVKQQKLKEGDRVLVGTSILKLVRQGAGSAGMDEVAARQKLEEVAIAQATKATKTAMTGKLEEVPLPDLLQLFHTSKKNGVLMVQAAEHVAKIYLRTGKVYYAAIDDNHDLGPQKSFNRIIRWEKGDFELLPPDKEAFVTELDSPTEVLLMEGLRQWDEFKRLEADLPPMDSAVGIVQPLTAPLKSLAPEALDVIQLVHNYGNLQAVIDHSDREDSETAQIVIDLISKEYIRAD